MKLVLKRVYERPEKSDGYRVLVDRLWPRGVSKEQARVDEWNKDVGPSNELRTWFGHDPEKYGDFKKKYEAELKTNKAAEKLREAMENHEVVTLVYSAKDEDHNQAVVLKKYLLS